MQLQRSASSETQERKWMEMITCNACGYRNNSPEVSYCGACGAKLGDDVSTESQKITTADLSASITQSSGGESIRRSFDKLNNNTLPIEGDPLGIITYEYNGQESQYYMYERLTLDTVQSDVSKNGIYALFVQERLADTFFRKGIDALKSYERDFLIVEIREEHGEEYPYVVDADEEIWESLAEYFFTAIQIHRKTEPRGRRRAAEPTDRNQRTTRTERYAQSEKRTQAGINIAVFLIVGLIGAIGLPALVWDNLSTVLVENAESFAEVILAVAVVFPALVWAFGGIALGLYLGVKRWSFMILVYTAGSLVVVFGLAGFFLSPIIITRDAYYRGGVIASLITGILFVTVITLLFMAETGRLL